MSAPTRRRHHGAASGTPRALRPSLPPPRPRTAPVILGLLAAALALPLVYVVAARRPNPDLWGIDVAAFLPRGIMVALLAGWAALTLLTVIRMRNPRRPK